MYQFTQARPTVSGIYLLAPHARAAPEPVEVHVLPDDEIEVYLPGIRGSEPPAPGAFWAGPLGFLTPEESLELGCENLAT